MEPAPAVVKLAVRRPDWELPELHAGLQLAPADVLWENKRSTCGKCGRSRAHYCYDCLEPLVPFPHVDLPFRVSIVTHHEEKASKNTGVQVAILASGQVDLHSMSNVPRDVDPARCAVLFPSDDALEVSELEPDSIDRLFIIDSRWKKAGELVRSDVFKSMRAVKLRETRSAFWRFHTKGVTDEGVCTIEALYFFLNSLAKEGKLTDPRFAAPHAFDNLLWYFCYQHQVVAAAAQRRLEAAQQQAAAAGGSGGEGESKGGEAAVGAAGQNKKGGKRGKQQQQQQQQHQQQQEQQRKGQGSQQQVGREQERSAGQGQAQQQQQPEPQEQERQHEEAAAEPASSAPEQQAQGQAADSAAGPGDEQPAKRARV
ncbi:hypothetical protein HYH02_012989 [Chlamydomonas schloesseri]|uniref:tRNA-uridine aminocarboxypropyltransferase 1 n=1 Tax=Chlamydomonas schloesseri TaxID=2026947 RepID=A0A835W088_9CHLO|nr:hypothetical protein HYH02_012989 [Chlamydomonas schloesseri]|eukprot:KAG2432418.1 hypothetical protein HYH02_012989 [Chlamydomonas schloesseri]